MKQTCYNRQMLDKMYEQAIDMLERKKAVNVSLEDYSKPVSRRQLGFFFGALIDSIYDYFVSCGELSWNKSTIKKVLYNSLSSKQTIIDFRGNLVEVPKTISEMDMKEMSDLIDGTIRFIDSSEMFKGLILQPDIRYCWVHRLEPEDVKSIDTRLFPRKDNEYLEYIRNQCCLVCGVHNQTEAHHLKEAGESGTAYKVDDWETIPLCQKCHRAYHDRGKQWLENELHWILKYAELKDFCSCCYNRWINHIGG